MKKSLQIKRVRIENLIDLLLDAENCVNRNVDYRTTELLKCPLVKSQDLFPLIKEQAKPYKGAFLLQGGAGYVK